MEIVNILYNGEGKSIQKYSDRDLSLINSTYINTTFGDPNDYIEAFISDDAGSILSYDYNLQSYYKTSEVNSGTNKFTSILVDPQKDVSDKGYNRGSVTIQYNILKNLFNSKYGVFYWIKDISPSRLELKLSSQQLSGDTMRSGFGAYQNYISQKNYYSDFYLNFGDNNLIVAVNAAYVNDDQGSYILIKLYEPLPSDFDIKSQLWIVDKLSEPVSFVVNVSIEAEQIDTTKRLRGPNYKIEVAQKIGQTTPYYSYNNLFSAQVSSSIRQLMSYYDDKAIAINTDYTDFNNFIHFSSATERISNFAYKVGLIENYNIQIVSQSAITGNSQVRSITTASINVLQTNIDSIIEKFDNYEYYLYYTSGTYAWPKINSAKPYSLHSVTSSLAVNWLGTPTTPPIPTKLSILYSASLYDQTNKDLLSVSAPQYLLDDPNNQPYVTFLDMIGQHFDNIWIYYKDVSSRFNATNDPNTGISMDLVSDALKGLGIELYTNTNLSDSAYYSLFGIDNVVRNSLPTGSTSSFPTGSEKNIKIISSSLASLPYDQIQKEINKRLYHNLPYLLKTRGTERGVKALIACYGIPDSILTVNEYGGTALGGEDIFELNDTKINIVTPNELSQSLLSPKSTLQQFDNNYRKNSLNVEVGFSPADTLNANITSSLVYSIDQLIGNPALRYSSSYDTLDRYRNNYFSSSYNEPHSIAEYVRLIKFYNNSLFKMIKDFVPARTNISTGIIVKPHVLERNKYARNEPEVETHRNYSQSIDMISISGSAATSYTWPTTQNKTITSSLGYITVNDSYGFENYTGEFQGTTLVATSLNSVGDQTELSQNSTMSSSRVNFGALYQNVTAAVRSQRRLDLDYTNNSRVPVNFGIVTKSIKDSAIDNFATYTNPMSPYAELQDYNYNIQRSTIPRYYGSKTTSRTYNTYSSASNTWPGDSSYGNTAAIDRNSFKVGWVKNIPIKALNFPDKTTIYLKYLIDSNQKITDLSLQNDNLFEVQNTFKTGDQVILSISDVNKPTNQKILDGTKSIFRGGVSYDPIIYREGYERLNFTYTDYVEVSQSYEGFYAPNYEKRIYTSIVYGSGNWLTYQALDNSSENQILPTDPDGYFINTDAYAQTNVRGVALPYTTNIAEVGYSGVYGDVKSTSDRVYDRSAPIDSADPKLCDISFGYTAWNSYLATNVVNTTTTPISDMNFTGLPSSYAISNHNRTLKNSSLKAYRIPIRIKFDYIDAKLNLINADENSYKKGAYTYLAPDSGRIDISFSHDMMFDFLANSTAFNNASYYEDWVNTNEDNGNCYLKLFGLLEKSTDQGNSWTIEKISNSPVVTYTGGTVTMPNNRVFLTPSAQNINISLTNFSLNLQAGDIIRYSIFAVDFQGLFRLTTGWKVRLNSTTANNPSTNFVQIYNKFIPFFSYNTSTYIDYSVDAFSKISLDTLIPSPKLFDLFNTSSIFVPTNPTSNYYSPIVDTTFIKPGDFIRFGSFNSPVIDYYNVISSGATTYDITTYTGLNQSDDDSALIFQNLNGFYNNLFGGGYNSSFFVFDAYLANKFNFILQNPTVTYIRIDGAYLSPTPPYSRKLANNGLILKLMPIRTYIDTTVSTYFPDGKYYVFIQDSITSETIGAGDSYRITDWNMYGYSSQTYSSYAIKLDRQVNQQNLNPQSDFAILRPKQDETSVIVNFSKKDGEVSQTILIPQDANNSVKSKIGEIFTNFNTDLQNNINTQA